MTTLPPGVSPINLRDTLAVVDPDSRKEKVVRVQELLQHNQFADMAEFNAAGGAVANPGPVWVGGKLAIDGIAAHKKSREIKIATYGDSTANYNDSQSPANNDTSVYSAPDPVSATVSLSPQVDKIALKNIMPNAQFVTNCGVSGRSLATMITNEAATSSTITRKCIDTSNNSPDVVLFRGGSINDLTAASYPITDNAYNTILDNHKTILVNLLTASDALVIDEGVYGFSEGLSGFPANANGDAIRDALIRLNADIKSYIESLNSLRCVFLNPVGLSCDTTGAFLQYYSYDGKHDAMLGALARAEAEKRIISIYVGESSNTTFAGKNLQINPLFSSLTSGIPDNYTSAESSATYGNPQVQLVDGQVWFFSDHTSTANGTSGATISIPVNPTATGTNPLNIAINDIYGFEVDVSVENITTGELVDIPALYGRLRFYSTGSGSIYSDNGISTTQPSGMSIKCKLKLHFSWKWKFQQGAASMTTSSVWQIYIRHTAAIGDVLRIGISNPRIVKLS